MVAFAAARLMPRDRTSVSSVSSVGKIGDFMRSFHEHLTMMVQYGVQYGGSMMVKNTGLR